MKSNMWYRCLKNCQYYSTIWMFKESLILSTILLTLIIFCGIVDTMDDNAWTAKLLLFSVDNHGYYPWKNYWWFSISMNAINQSTFSFPSIFAVTYCWKRYVFINYKAQSITINNILLDNSTHVNENNPAYTSDANRRIFALNGLCGILSTSWEYYNKSLFNVNICDFQPRGHASRHRNGRH
jgi:hypothetical protein